MRLTLFDLDGTLLPIDSDHAFGEFLVRIGWADKTLYRDRNEAFFQQYQLGQLDIKAYIDFATTPWRNRAEMEIRAASTRFVDEVVRPVVHAQALALVEQHQATGELIAIVTATNEFITRPVANLFGVQHLIATELERDKRGRVTGGILGTPSFREGKVVRVQQWLQTMGCEWRDFERVTFYSDSTNDLPLLEAVSHPVATNPSTELATIARSRGWPILRLFD